MKFRILKTIHHLDCTKVVYLAQVKRFIFWKNLSLFNGDDGDFYALVNYRTNWNQFSTKECAESFLKEWLEIKEYKKPKDIVLPFQS